jgi:hypothetical protein
VRFPSPTPAADHPWAQMVGMTCGRISPATATRRATGHRGWESGLGWGCYRQATANDVSKRRPNFHHQLPSTKAVPDVGNDKRFNVGLLSDVPPGQRLAPVWRILWEQILAALDIPVRNRVSVGVGSGQECPMPLGFERYVPAARRGSAPVPERRLRRRSSAVPKPPPGSPTARSSPRASCTRLPCCPAARCWSQAGSLTAPIARLVRNSTTWPPRMLPYH